MRIGLGMALFTTAFVAFSQTSGYSAGNDGKSGIAWRSSANHMCDERWAPSAITLSTGNQALIAGGFSYSAGTCVATADIYDEATNAFTRVASRMTYPRDFATASMLPGGRVLIAGGYNLVLGSLFTLEIFDPTNRRFTLAQARLSEGRELFSATTLADGRILFAGGFNTHTHHTLDSADIYDPAAGTCTAVRGRMAQDRFGHAAQLLRDGRVLIVGGKHWRVGKPDRFLASAEIYDPAADRFFPAKNEMSTPRDRPTTSLLPDGRVLISGGQAGSKGPLACDIFDPATETFTVAPAQMHDPRMAHGGAETPFGFVVAGGWDPVARKTTASAETYDLLAGFWRTLPELPFDAHDLALVTFEDGGILAAGGKFSQPGKEGSRSEAAFFGKEHHAL